MDICLGAVSIAGDYSKLECIRLVKSRNVVW